MKISVTTYVDIPDTDARALLKHFMKYLSNNYFIYELNPGVASDAEEIDDDDQIYAVDTFIKEETE